MAKDGKNLTQKQRIFVLEYIQSFNATEAARRAGYSERSASETGHENLRKPQIQAAIAEAVNKRMEGLEVSADRVLNELARIAFSDIRDYTRWGENGVRLRPSDEISEDAARAVSMVSEASSLHGGSTSFKLHDKKGALELLGKHLKLFTDKVEQSGPAGGPVQFINVREQHVERDDGDVEDEGMGE